MYHCYFTFRGQSMKKFKIVFDNSGDEIPLSVIYNHELFEFFVSRLNEKNQNSFTENRCIYKNVEPKLTHLHWAISDTNSVLYDLIGKSFDQHTNLENYLDQQFLNKLHSDWVFSQYDQVKINNLKSSSNATQARLGNILHDMLSDDITELYTAVAMEKIGKIYQYEEVNMGVHRLENEFKLIEFHADAKWEIFENPYVDTMITNNDIVNFSFGYTYVGRQYYDKFKNFDLNLDYPDNYNYEHLEFAFQLNLKNPETLPFSKEAILWAKSKNIKLVAEQIPIANIDNLYDNLFKYRKILFQNSKNNNRAKIEIN